MSDTLHDPGLFQNTAASHVFHFTYAGEPRLLKGYLAERYRYWLNGEWMERAYPERVWVNRAPAAEEAWVAPGDVISYRHLRDDEPVRPGRPPVLWEDERTLVLYKPDNVPVSPSGPYYFASLAIHAREAFGNPELTPIHRLDLETDGPVVFAKRSADLRHFHELFRRQAIRKTYRALVYGRFPQGLQRIAGRIFPDPASAIRTKLAFLPDLASESSVTHVSRVVWHGPFSELELEPRTGKTNQLRVHLAHLGHPIVGDKKYHADEGVFLQWIVHKDFGRLRERLLLPRQALQCHALAFPHPFTGEPVEVRAPEGSWARQIAPAVESAFERESAGAGAETTAAARSGR